MDYRKGLLAALVAPLLAVGGGAAEVHAAGYAVFTHGASALGQGNAVTAHTDDASTIFYNPALMNRLDGTQFVVGTTAIISSRDYTNAAVTGHPASGDGVNFPSHFYVTHKFNDRLSAGFGVFNPFGLSTEWNNGWDGRYIATKSQMTTYDFNPAVSCRVLPFLTLAAGVDVVYLDATLQKMIPSAALAALHFPSGYDIGQKFTGNGTGVGYNLGAAWDIGERVTVGASYRSQVHVDVSGDASFSSAVLPVSALNSGGKTEITLPPQFTAGVAVKGTDRLTLEGGLRWEGWSKFKDLTIKLDNGSANTTPRDWRDSWGLNLGGRYRMNDTVALMAGYVYGDSAAPDSTFDPSIPDARTHVFCAGTDLDLKPVKVALSYGYQRYVDRKRSNSYLSPLADGTYRSDAHLVALSLGYKF